jgi:hypothetical protein
MNHTSLKIIMWVILVVFFFFGLLNGQTSLKIGEIVEKNIEAVVGERMLQDVKNFSFLAGTNRYYVLPDGKMKVLTGMKAPVIIAVTLVSQDIVKENIFHDIQMIEGTEKSRLQCFARLAGGIFTLAPFKDSLSYQGMKKFGLESYHLIVTQAFDLDVTFSVDAETYQIKRMTLKKYSAEEGHFEFSYEFGAPVMNMGFNIPSYIFSSPVGTQTSVNPEPQEISDVRFNSVLADRFFSDIGINMGEVSVTPGCLKGNVLDFLFFPPRPYFVVVTNWQRRDVDQAGLRTGDNLVLDMDGIKSELTLLISEAEDGYIDTSVLDARFMTMDPLRGGLYFLYFNLKDSEEAERIKSRLVPLLPIQAKKNDTKEKKTEADR